MRPTVEGEIVFEGALEARVAAQLLKGSSEGVNLLESVTPAIEPAGIGPFKFISELAELDNGLGDKTDYVCEQAASPNIMTALFSVSRVTSPERPTLDRKRWMGQRLFEFTFKLEAMGQKLRPAGNARTFGHIVDVSEHTNWPNPADAVIDPSRHNVLEVGGLTIVGASDSDTAILKGREAFVNGYCAENNWVVSDLTIDQIMEIRSQSGWKTPA
jgi:hypothetical protein